MDDEPGLSIIPVKGEGIENILNNVLVWLPRTRRYLW